MANVIADRRAAARFPLIAVAQITEVTSGAKLMARTSDVSRTGCYIDTLNPVPKSSQIHLRLTSGNEVFETLGTVAYVSSGLGMGVRFADGIPENQLIILDRWLATAARSV